MRVRVRDEWGRDREREKRGERKIGHIFWWQFWVEGSEGLLDVLRM